MPKVTVIVPNYNHSRFLDQRIESVLAQTCQDFEVILMDDASSDNSLSIFDKYSAHPLVSAILRNDTNSGIPFKQWNAGVARAQGEYIWLAESDDYADPRLLQTLVDLLDRHPQVGLAYCQSLAVDENGKALFSLRDWTDDLDNRRWALDFINDGREECRRYVALKCTVPNASAVVFRRSTFVSVGNADEDFRLSGDWMLWAKLMLASDVAFTAQTLNFFRVHGNTVRKRSQRTAVALEEAMRIFCYIDERIEVPLDVRDKACNQFLDRWFGELSRLRLSPRLNFEIYRRIRALDGRLHQRVARKALRSMRTRMARA